MDAVPLERDGKLNKKFRQELLLGADTNDLQIDETGRSHKHNDNDGKTIEELIDELFQRADTDLDKRLSEKEVEDSIIANIIHHLDESQKEAKDVMEVIDQVRSFAKGK